MPHPAELVILAGLQASGKSTYRSLRFDRTHVVVSKDRMGRSARRKQARQERQITEALQAGHPVVVDNTNPTAEDRRPLLELGRRFGVPVIGHGFEPDLEASLVRNAARQGRWQVPEFAMRAVAARWEPPSADEGFDAVWAVSARPWSTFVARRLHPGSSHPCLGHG